MRKFQKATAVIMAAALAATGCSAGGTKTSAPQQPSGTEAAKTEAAAGADKTEAAKDTGKGTGLQAAPGYEPSDAERISGSDKR